MSDEALVNDDQEEEVDSQTEDTDGGDGEEEYVPNYSYTVRGKELEFDEAIKPLVTSKEAEEYLRSIHSKAGVMEHHQEKISSLESELGTSRSQVSGYERQMNEAQASSGELEFLREKDPVEYCRRVGVDPFKIVRESVDLEEQNGPDYLQNRSQGVRQEWETRQISQQKDQRDQDVQRLVRENAVQKLELAVMKSPDAQALTESGVDVVALAREYGYAHYQEKGADPSFDQAVSTIVGRYKPVIDAKRSGAQGADGGEPPAEKPKKKPKTIPNSGTNQGSQGSIAIKSIEDLKRIRKEKFGAGG